MKTKAKTAKQNKPSKSFINEMARMYPKGATITPKKAGGKSSKMGSKKR